jgi:hypothetical protein
MIIAPDSRMPALLSIQHRLADLMFVELLFEKGPREVTMIHDEYNWRKSILMKQQEAVEPHAEIPRAGNSGDEGATQIDPPLQGTSSISWSRMLLKGCLVHAVPVVLRHCEWACIVACPASLEPQCRVLLYLSSCCSSSCRIAQQQATSELHVFSRCPPLSSCAVQVCTASTIFL